MEAPLLAMAKSVIYYYLKNAGFHLISWSND